MLYSNCTEGISTVNLHRETVGRETTERFRIGEELRKERIGMPV